MNHRNTLGYKIVMIRIAYDQYDTFEDSYAHMYFKTLFLLQTAIRLSVYGRASPGGKDWNSATAASYLHSQSAESNDYGQYFPVSIEIQLLGGLGAGERPTGNVCTPGTALVMDGKVDYRHCISSNSKTYHGDRWVSAEVVVLGGESITHLIENDTVLKYQSPHIGGGFTNPKMGDKDWTSRGVVQSKDHWIAKAAELLTQGHISLQAESHPIDFKTFDSLTFAVVKTPEPKTINPILSKPIIPFVYIDGTFHLQNFNIYF